VVLHDLVVEDGEVEGKAELDGVAGGQLDLVGLVVSLQGRLLNLIEEGVTGVLSDVAVVVTDHLDEEGLGLTVAVLRENVLVDDINDVLAVLGEGLLDFELVGGECGVVLLVLGVLLDGGNGAAGGSLGGDQVLESHGEEVALIGGDVGALLLEDLGQEGDHVFESLGLFSNAGKEASRKIRSCKDIVVDAQRAFSQAITYSFSKHQFLWPNTDAVIGKLRWASCLSKC